MQVMEITRCQYMPGTIRGKQQHATDDQQQSGCRQIRHFPPGHQGSTDCQSGTLMPLSILSLTALFIAHDFHTLSSSSFLTGRTDPDGLKINVRIMARKATTIW